MKPSPAGLMVAFTGSWLVDSERRTAHAGVVRLSRRSRRGAVPHHAGPRPGGGRRPPPLLSRLDRRQEGDRGDDRHRHGERRPTPPRLRLPASPAGPPLVGAVVFSGVAGGAGRTRIADVAVPARWTLDNGTTFHPVDPAMLAAAESSLSHWKRRRRSICGACRELLVGGDGCSYDNNNGQAFPCIPNGGDVFGCQPRSAPDRSLLYTGQLLAGGWPLAENALISNLNIVLTSDPAFDATDNETAAVQAVADAHGIPFLGIRGISDGPGDPLHLPGFPFQFFCLQADRGRQRRPSNGGFSAELGRRLTGRYSGPGPRGGSDPNTTPTTTPDTAPPRSPSRRARRP